MELKAFKGMPHEFGGIDYTEGSEVEGGEFAVQIGKSGNEYIFDKNSSEGERLSKEYKRLDKNGRLTEDDPLALEAFDQIAREEALKHAQRSVNEKGIDPFRNMYDQGGQAANGGVKYAAGGAKDMYFTGGGMGSFGSMMGGIGGGFDMIGDLFKTPDINFDAMFKPISGGENPNLVNPQRYMNLVSNDSTDMTALKQLMQGERGETTQLPMDFAGMFKSKEAQQDVAEAQQKIDAVPNSISGASGIGGMIGGLIRGDSKAGQLKEPVSFRKEGDRRHFSQGPEFYKMEGKDYVASHLEGAASGAMTGLQTAGPWGALGGAILGGVINPIKDKLQEDKLQKEATMQFHNKLAEVRDSEIDKSIYYNIATDVDGSALIDKDRYAGIMRNGGAKPIYGYYADGGGKSYTDKIKEAENDLNQSLGNPMNKAFDAFQDEYENNPRLAGDDMYLDPYRHGMAGYYTADAMKKKMPDWMPESVANKLAIAGSTIAGIGHEFASPATERMGLVDALTEAGQDAYNNYVGAKMIENVLFDREAKQLMLDKIKREETYPGVVVSDTDPYNLPKNAKEALDRGFTFDQMIDLEKRGLIDLTDLTDGTSKFQDGGGKKKEDEYPTGPTGANEETIGIAVSPTGAAYSSDLIDTDVDYSRGLLDYLPPHMNQYLYTFFGGKKPFTEKQLRPQDIAAWQDILENRTIQDKYKEEVTRLEGKYDDEKYVGYDDFNRFGALPTEKITSSLSNLYKAFTDPYTIAKLTAGKAQVADGTEVFGDWNFATNKSFDELQGGLDVLAYLWNLSPFIDDEGRKRQATKSGPNAAMQFTIPKRNK